MPDTVMTNTYLPAGPGGVTLEFESLRDVVEMVSRDETPLWSNIRKGKATALKEDWGTESLGTITAAPARSLGFVAAPTPAVPNRRLTNWTQLVAEEGSVSDSMNAVDGADDTNTYEHQVLKKGIILARRINKLMHTPQAYDATPALPKVGTYFAYVQPAMWKSVATTPGTAGTGNGTDIPTLGTGFDDFDSITPIDEVLEASRQFNGEPDTMYLTPRMKRFFSRIPDASVAENRQTASVGKTTYKHVGVVDAYFSDFGDIECVVDIDANNQYVPILDHDYIDCPILPGLDFDEKKLAVRGSAEEFMIQTQFTLRYFLPESMCLVQGYKA